VRTEAKAQKFKKKRGKLLSKSQKRKNHKLLSIERVHEKKYLRQRHVERKVYACMHIGWCQVVNRAL
jgi:hypothetical protein